MDRESEYLRYYYQTNTENQLERNQTLYRKGTGFHLPPLDLGWGKDVEDEVACLVPV